MKLENPIHSFVTGPLGILVMLHYKDTYIDPLTNTKTYGLSYYFEIANEVFELDYIRIDF